MMSDDELKIVKIRVAKKLQGFSRIKRSTFDDMVDLSSYKLNRSEFPVPDLILFMLRDVMDFEWQSYGEKVRWSIFFALNDVPLALEYRKFGLTLIYPRDKSVNISRLCGQLQSAIPVIENVLDKYAQEQVELGNFSVVNKFYKFDDRYKFFRQSADDYYKMAVDIESSTDKDTLSFELIIHNLNTMMGYNVRAGYLSVSMIDCYFSRLEHILLLLLAFQGNPLSEGEVKSFLLSKWDKKLLNIVSASEMKRVFKKLKTIKQQIRNPFAHGGVENDLGSIFVHFPNLDALPANFSQFKNSLHFKFLPVQSEEHSLICKTFDELDVIIQCGHLASAFKMISGGISPSFDRDSLNLYNKLRAGAAEDLEAFIDCWNDAQDRHENMDY